MGFLPSDSANMTAYSCFFRPHLTYFLLWRAFMAFEWQSLFSIIFFLFFSPAGCFLAI